MNERQRDLMLWQWSRRRRVGKAAVSRRGAWIGAASGLVFALVMAGGIHRPNGSAQYFLPWLQSVVALLAISVALAAICGYLGAARVYAQQEMMFQAQLSRGARVPDQAPVMRLGDRWPAIVVGVSVVLMIVAVAALWIAYL